MYNLLSYKQSKNFVYVIFGYYRIIYILIYKLDIFISSGVTYLYPNIITKYPFLNYDIVTHI